MPVDYELQPQPVDVPLAPLDQTPPSTAGPLGRLTSLTNAQITKYLPAASTPGVATGARVKVEQREAFRALTSTIHDVQDGSTITPSWTRPGLLDSLDNQLVAINSGIPRVYNGSTWSGYPTRRVVTRKLSQSIMHTVDGIMQCSDSAWLGGVTCGVFIQSSAAWIGFRADNGTWVVRPKTFGNNDTMTKVVSDGSVFWAFFVGGGDIWANVYTTAGVLLSSINTIPKSATVGSNYDITAQPGGGVLLAQDDGAGHVKLWSLTQSGGVITVTGGTADTGMSCTGNLGWLANPVDNLAYLATSTTSFAVKAYRIAGLTHTLVYDVGNSGTTCDSLTGWTEAEGGGGVTVNVVVGTLSNTARTSGPKFDTRYRGTDILSRTSANLPGPSRSNFRSVIPVSRSFKLDDDWYAVTYYQGGPGLTQTPTTTTVSWTIGDQMKGPAVQPLIFSPGDYQYGNTVTLPGLPSGVSEIVVSGGVATYYMVASSAMLALGNSFFNTIYQPTCTLTVSGATNSGNNGTFNIASINLTGSIGVTITCTATTQVTETANGHTVFSVKPPSGSVNTWLLQNPGYNGTVVPDASWENENLFVAGTSQGANSGENTITTAQNDGFITLGSTAALQPEVIPNPVPTSDTVALHLADPSTAYQFTLQSVTFDQTYIGALISVQNSGDTNDDTIYQITEVTGTHTVIALPLNGTTNQINRRFDNTVSIAISFPSTNVNGTQQTWFLTPLSAPVANGQVTAGRWEYGIAYADWRFDGQSTLNLYPCQVSSVVATAAGYQVVLPYRAENVTASVVAPTGNPVDAFTNTIGLKAFTFANSGSPFDNGQSLTVAGELLIPGPQASEFTASGFAEHGINLGPEKPFLVSQTNDGTIQVGLTPGTAYQVVVVFECTDEDGDRIYSIPSEPLNFFLQTGNNTATYGGNLLGPTNRVVAVSIYRTSIQGGVTTVQHYKVTNDTDPNGAGFTFPDNFTWNFKDQIPDVNILSSEILYTDKGYLPRYPAPAFSQGVGTWQNRTWVVGYDGAVWMSGEKTEGDAVWFHPALRYTLPTDDEPTCIAAMDDYMIVLATLSSWYIPRAQFPDATGNNGTMPNPVQLPFSNGGTGFAATTSNGVIYSSTAGGVWIITRNLTNQWQSQAVQTSLTSGSVIYGIAVDSKQRVHVAVAGGFFVWDTVVGAWYTWLSPSAVLCVGTYQGQIVYADGAQVVKKTPGSYLDNVGASDIRGGWSITLAPIHLMGSVRGYGRCWAIQGQGEYEDVHTAQLTLGYGDEVDYQPPTVFPAFTPDPTKSYLYEWNPAEEEASQFEITLSTQSTGGNGNTATLELFSFDVGVDQGMARVAAGKRVSSAG